MATMASGFASMPIRRSASHASAQPASQAAKWMAIDGTTRRGVRHIAASRAWMSAPSVGERHGMSKATRCDSLSISLNSPKRWAMAKPTAPMASTTMPARVEVATTASSVATASTKPVTANSTCATSSSVRSITTTAVAAPPASPWKVSARIASSSPAPGTKPSRLPPASRQSRAHNTRPRCGRGGSMATRSAAAHRKVELRCSADVPRKPTGPSRASAASTAPGSLFATSTPTAARPARANSAVPSLTPRAPPRPPGRRTRCA